MSELRNNPSLGYAIPLRSLILHALLLALALGAGQRVVAQAAEQAPPKAAPPKAEPAKSLESAVKRVLQAKCGKCHGKQRAEAELDLSTPQGLAMGGEAGAVIDRKNWRDSLLWQRVAEGEMPPEEAPQLKPSERRALRDWLAAGAKFAAPVAQPQVTQHDIVHLMLLRCTVCHGGRRQEANLDLRTPAAMLRGGKSGPAIVPGNPAASLVMQRIHAGEMPPRRQLVRVSVKPMAPAEVKRLETWIAQGATSSDEGGAPDLHSQPNSGSTKHWAFQSPRAAAPPPIKNRHTVESPIDAFLLSALEARGLGFSPPAPPRVWFRRVTLDLIGVPPTPTEMQQFLADRSPLARHRAVERLLASPRYGERWAPVWLDAAGYADSEGSQNEDRIRPDMFRYRDYVIRSFNSDKSYRRFLLEQIAGDELADYRKPDGVSPEVFDNIVATGFLRTAPDRTFAGITNFVPDRLELIADEIHILGSTVFGLTLHCARCHSHKFDPISQRDYFRLTGLLKDALDEHDWLGPEQRKLSVMPKAELSRLQRHNESMQNQVDALSSKLKTAEEGQKSGLKKQIEALEKKKLKPWRIRALWSRGQPSPTYLLRRGDYLKPGPLVAPAAPQVLVSTQNPLIIAPQSFGAVTTSGRRLALARWLTHDSHPLTARVMVNRIWAEHFGRGLVRTLDNFGVAGERPTHPELLDRLAVDFIRDGWSIKSLQRRIVLSQAYGQSSQVTPQRLAADPDGRFLSRMPLRRMNAEMVRDSLLQVSGRLREQPFGAPDGVSVSPSGLSVSEAKHDSWRRSVYVLHRRTQMPSILESFDAPQMSPNCVQRRQSIVATQALHLMNNGMVQQLAEHFAARVAEEAEPDRRLSRAFELAWSRPPTESERRVAQSAFAKLVAAWTESGANSSIANQRALETFCHSLLNSAAFVYIE